MSKWTIYHNPKCSKSRQTLALLEEKGVEPKVVEYLKTPPDLEALKKLVKALGVAPQAIVRTKEALFKELKLDLSDDAAVLRALAKNPSLIERPIVVKDSKAVIGRPPENVLDLMSSKK